MDFLTYSGLFPSIIMKLYKRLRRTKYQVTLDISLLLTILFNFLMKAKAGFTCDEEGKFLDHENRNRYHQCYNFYGKIKYIYNTCPVSTCFDPNANYCISTACPSVSTAVIPKPPTELEARRASGTSIRPYDCTGRKFKCNKKRGVFAHPDDHSAYFQCLKLWGKWKSICFTCNKEQRTCFSNSFQACIHIGKPCGTGRKTEDPIVNPLLPFATPKTATYTCNGYDTYPCNTLGVGTHGMPGDKSVYWQCTQKGAICKTCKKPDDACYIERKDSCIPNCGLDFHKPYNCATYKGDENYDCKGKTGIFANPEDTSIFFSCEKSNKTGLVKAECFTCNKEKKTCFSNAQQACVTYMGEKCPHDVVIDGPNDNGAVGDPEDSLSYDCKGYNKLSLPCASYGQTGFYEHPGDRSVYFECVKHPDSFGGFVWIANCNACKEATNQCYSKKKKKCVKNCGRTKPKPYDCSLYPENHFKCHESGYHSNPNDTSIYFGCWFPQEGGYTSLCFTCNSVVKTCFDDNEKRCVTNAGKDKCGTSTDLAGNPDRGDGMTSLTFSCNGYSSQSFPCRTFEAGFYALPGDPSVYVKCGALAAGDMVHDDEEESVAISKFESCHECSSATRGCFDDEKGVCVDDCGEIQEPTTTTTEEPQITTIKVPEIGTERPGDNETGVSTDKPDETTTIIPTTEIPTTTLIPTTTTTPIECHESTVSLSKCEDSDLFGETPRYFNCFSSPGGSWSKRCINCRGAVCRSPSVTLDPKTSFNQTLVSSPPPKEIKLPDVTNCTDTMKALPTCARFLYNSTSHFFNCFENPGGNWKQSCVKCLGSSCTAKETSVVVNGTVRPYDCSGYTDTSYPCLSEGLFPHPKDPTVFFECSITPETLWVSLCYECNSASRSCFDKDKKLCVIGCVGVGDGTPPGSNSTGVTYGDNCVGYSDAIQCSYKMSLLQTIGKDVNDIPFHLHAHPGDRAVYFECASVDNKWVSLCHLCPISTCFSEEKQNCITEGCSEYKPDPGNNLGPFKPHDCRFYHLQAYPCTEEGTFANPIDTSVYFDCRKVGANVESFCYSCNKNQKTCFVQTRGACLPSKEGNECGPARNLTTLGKPSMSYDCSGYDPTPEASVPMGQLGKGVFGVPGDFSVFWIIKLKDNSYEGECHACSQASKACYDPEKMQCVDNCQRKSNKPYDCKVYSDPTSFSCPYEGYVAPDFDSSVFFKCKKSGKKFSFECYSCNSKYKTCFSNKLQVCVTKGNKPCGSNDPSLPPLGGTEEASRTYNCTGLDVSRFPCRFYGEGSHPFKGDKSVYVSCLSVNGRYVAVCTACSKETRGCYDERAKDCIENCGKGPHEPYNCATYDELSYPCTKLGYYANPKDTSIYFRCVPNEKGGYKALCYSCNSEVGTCFDEKTGACVQSGKGSCGTSSDINPEAKPELTYECNGYNELSFPCTALGVGKHANPADFSVFFNCLIKGGKFVAQCESCLQKEKGCYIEREKKCIENCGRGPPQPYDCSEPYDFKCEKEGIFPDIKDTSTYFRCNTTSTGRIVEECFTCNKNLKTCFSNKLQACVTYGGHACDTSDPADSEGSGSVAGSRPYTCKGYGDLAFPCGKHVTGGKYGSPGDASVYFECNDEKKAVCTSCVPDMDACFIPEKGKCTDNCGKGPNKPYSCGTYDESSYQCSKSGYFAHPKDSSVFFKCVQVGEKWESWCHTCNMNKKTCFSNSQQACITNSGNACGDMDPFIDNPNGGTEETSRSYDCEGFDVNSFPCQKYPVGKVFIHPGDKSVYFRCVKNGKEKEAKCNNCKKENHGCYSLAANKCIENCYRGPHYPYDCGKYAYDAYPCTKEGGFFANPDDAAVYFGCARNRGTLMTYCYACNRKRMTCFSNTLQACVTVGAKSTHADGCGSQGDPKLYPDAGTEESSRTYDCEGYFTTSFPCHRLMKEGKFGIPGDKSVYFECLKRKDGVWVAKCHVCPRASQSCFVENRQECVDRCGLGPLVPTKKPTTKKPHKDKIFTVPEGWEIPDFEGLASAQPTNKVGVRRRNQHHDRKRHTMIR